jgi:hypothetical protein
MQLQLFMRPKFRYPFYTGTRSLGNNTHDFPMLENQWQLKWHQPAMRFIPVNFESWEVLWVYRQTRLKMMRKIKFDVRRKKK